MLVLGFLYGSRGTKLKSSLLCGKHFTCGTIFSPLWIFKKIPAWLLVPSYNLVGVFFHGEGKKGFGWENFRPRYRVEGIKLEQK